MGVISGVVSAMGVISGVSSEMGSIAWLSSAVRGAGERGGDSAGAWALALELDLGVVLRTVFLTVFLRPPPADALGGIFPPFFFFFFFFFLVSRVLIERLEREENRIESKVGEGMGASIGKIMGFLTLGCI